MADKLEFVTKTTAPATGDTCLLVGHKARLADKDVQAFVPSLDPATWKAMLGRLSGGDHGDSTETWVGTQRVVLLVLPEHRSRHNSSSHPHAIAKLVRASAGKKGQIDVVLGLDCSEDAVATGAAVARAFSTYSRKTPKKGKKAPKLTVKVHFVAPEGDKKIAISRVRHVAQGVRLAARLCDMPASELHTDAFVQEAKEVASAVGAKMKVIRGKDLDKKGFGGLWGVGRAAVHPPSLVILSHEPEGAKGNIAWVGKGIVYDTGGLSIKTKGGMPGMKSDMGGAAGVLGAFLAAAGMKVNARIHAVLCLAENSVGPDSTRPDDILHMYSGKTVEVNNTDAEGRLVLADGVAYAAKKLKADTIVDMATLTGAQLLATGRRHAGIMTNDEDLERAVCEAGRASGDLAHPLPYCPEFFRSEFKSKVADMKNSVKDRMNAQSSCAGQFIAEHLGDFDGRWLHIDMAGPREVSERGTGYGVALLTTLFPENT